MNTENSSMRLLSPSGTDRTHTELIARRLKAADPTIVLAPSSPGSCASQPHSPGLLSPLQGPTRLSTVSMTERRISGAEEPSARSVRFATVAFHTLTCTVSFSPVFSFTCVIIRFFEVMTSIADLRAWRKRVGGGVSRAGSRRRRARGLLLRPPHARARARARAGASASAACARGGARVAYVADVDGSRVRLLLAPHRAGLVALDFLLHLARVLLQLLRLRVELRELRLERLRVLLLVQLPLHLLR